MGVRVLIVDDQEPFRMAARMVVDATDGFEVVGEAETGEDSVAMAERPAARPGADGREPARDQRPRRDPADPGLGTGRRGPAAVHLRGGGVRAPRRRVRRRPPTSRRPSSVPTASSGVGRCPRLPPPPASRGGGGARFPPPPFRCPPPPLSSITSLLTIRSFSRWFARKPSAPGLGLSRSWFFTSPPRLGVERGPGGGRDPLPARRLRADLEVLHAGLRWVTAGAG